MNLLTPGWVIGVGSILFGCATVLVALHSANLPSWESPAAVTQSLDGALIQRPTDEQLKTDWIVTPSEAIALIQDGATVLDARTKLIPQFGTIEGAIAVSWRQFSQTQSPNQGKLLTNDAQLSQRLQDVGIFQAQPVVVLGDPQRGWGEDGRIVWMLRTLGHHQAVLVDGGYPALVAAGMPTKRAIASTATPKGDFIVRRTSTWEVERDALQAAIGRSDVVILDVREQREFNGNTPYGERRGGHLPGAKHLHFRELLDESGAILPSDQLLSVLAEQGIMRDDVIISYCTGGVRSGWVTSVLTAHGFTAKNYAGSMWEWSTLSPDHYPLTTQQ